MGNSLKSRLLIVLGTRPEAIKLAPLILALKKNPRFHVTVCATGQHREILRSALESFSIQTDVNLELMTQNQSIPLLFARATEGIEKILCEEPYAGVIVQGDTTTCASASLAAFYRSVPVFHVEAGLRSSSLNSPFPEEFNRRLVALSARGHFCPTREAASNLFREHVDSRNVLVTGNTGIDSLFLTLKAIESDSGSFGFLDENLTQLKSDKYILVTLHRRENFGPALRYIFADLKALAASQACSVILPLHPNPNVRKEAESVFGRLAGWLGLPSGGDLYLCDPVEYGPFIRLLSQARLIITDSGGIQEEGSALGKSMLICRDRTERPEALMQKNVRLVPPREGALYQAAQGILDLNLPEVTSNAFGSGHASEQICVGLESYFQAGFINPTASMQECPIQELI